MSSILRLVVENVWPDTIATMARLQWSLVHLVRTPPRRAQPLLQVAYRARLGLFPFQALIRAQSVTLVQHAFVEIESYAIQAPFQ